MTRLESWKEIAQHLNRTVRTVQRWEREQGLPVHRLPHNKLASVFAYTQELDAWWEKRRRSLETEGASQVAPLPAAPSAQAGIWFRASALVLVAVAVGAAIWIGIDRYRKPAESDRLYQLGRHKWNERTQAGFREALSLFQQSIAANPSNARAYAGLADTYSLLDAFSDMPRSEALPNAHAAAAKAVQLDDSLSEPHASLGFVLWAEGDRDGAFREMERSIALDSTYATAYHWYALFLQDSSRYAEAVTAAKRAHELEPRSPIIATDLALIMRNAGRPAESVALLEEIAAKHPSFQEANIQLAEAYRVQRDYLKAAEHLTRAVQLGDTRPAIQARRAWLYAQTGNLLYAYDTLRRFQLMHTQGEYVPPLALLEVVTAAGDLDFAFQLIDQAVRARESWVILIADADIFRRLTEDPRWSAVKSGLTATAITAPAREALSPIATTR